MIPSSRRVLLTLTLTASQLMACGDGGGGPVGDSHDGAIPGPQDAGADSDTEDEDGDADASVDAASQSDATAPVSEDGSLPAEDAGADASTPSCECSGTTPACVNGACVECGPDNSSRCESFETCDLDTHTCVDRYAPFQLDCANLPVNAGGDCHGGPIEMLTVTHDTGAVALFDVHDGHFLGYLKRATVSPSGSHGTFWLSTQGPDQCIWTVNDGDRGIERWDTHGKYLNNVIPADKYYEAGTNNPIINVPQSFAFTEDKIYVASTKGTPKPRVSRFDLAGNFEKVVLDNGPSVRSLLVLRDGSFLVNSEPTREILRIPSEGTATQVLGGVRAFQVSYAGQGQILAFDNGTSGQFYKVSIEDGSGMHLLPTDPGDDLTAIAGVAPLKNGRWLFAGANNTVGVLDPLSSSPSGQFETVFADPLVTRAGFNHIGRACLSQDAIDVPDPVEASCDEPVGENLFKAGFEPGEFDQDDFVTADGERHYGPFIDTIDWAGTVTLDDAVAFAGSRSLKIETTEFNLTPNDRGGVLALEALKPTYISYRVRVADNAAEEYAWLGYFEPLPTGVPYWNRGYLTRIMVNGKRDQLYLLNVSEVYARDLEVDVEPDSWVHVQLRDINWERGSYDLYVNCERVGDDLWLGGNDGNGLGNILFVNEDIGTSWFDDIVIKK